MWTPYDIEVLLWHFYGVGPYKGHCTPAYGSSIAKLKGYGLVVEDGGACPYRATELGEALVNLWRETPIPVVKYIDPRFEKLSRQEA